MALTSMFALSPIYFFNSSYRLQGEWEKETILAAQVEARCTLSLWHAGLMHAEAICNVHLRPRASHLQLLQWCCRTAGVKESSRKGKELCLSESTEHNRAATIHTMLKVQLWQQPHNLEGTPRVVMEMSLCAALLMYSLPSPRTARFQVLQ